jgi:hypothetical protein
MGKNMAGKGLEEGGGAKRKGELRKGMSMEKIRRAKGYKKERRKGKTHCR